MSLMVISPLSSPCLFTTGSFSMRCSCKISRAFSRLVPSGAVISLSRFMTCETLRSKRVSNRRSRLVRIADELPVLGDGNAGDAVLRHQLVGVAYRLIRRDGDGIENHPAFGLFDPIDFGRLIGRGQYAMDNPEPAFARHGNGQRDSVTVSIAELMMGMLISIFRVKCVRTSTSLGRMADFAGTRTTSSYVSPRRGSFSNIHSP